MRKICCLLFAVFILCISASCYRRKETRISQPVIMPAIQSPEDIDDYIGEKGYEILESKGKTEEYTLDKKRVYNNWQIWAVQYPEPDHYLGKEISIYSYIIRNHPLDDKSPNKKTYLSVMICENTIIGGYSSPYYEEKDISLVPIGGVYSLEGKNFEEIKNINFDRWRKRFIKKYE